jgi:acyl-CoA reductase-like NAD-dependent aldehyde dehydrogenase
MEEDRKFYLEAEGNDYAVIDETVPLSKQTQAVSWILQSILRHDGQICQAVRGVFVHEQLMDSIVHKFRKLIDSVEVLPAENPKSGATEHPQLILDPSQETMSTSYFGSRLWLKRYTSENELTEYLNRNLFGLTLSVFSEKQFEDIKAAILDKTTYARIVINEDPAFVHPQEPWGGLLRSGMSGVEDWLHKFTDKVLFRLKE